MVRRRVSAVSNHERPWPILRDAVARLLRMRRERVDLGPCGKIVLGLK
jgi:hypothetical protein